MTVQIKEVTTTGDLKKFIRFPNELYKGNEYWVPALFFDEMNTLRWDKNPAFKHCEAKYWLAYQDGEIVGRIAGIYNQKHLEKWGENYIRFGWVDFIDDPDVSRALFETVEKWAKEKGMTSIHGPLGFTDLDREGMLVEGFEELGTLATMYNYAYYPEHLEKLGFRKDIDWMEYEVKIPDEPIEKLSRVAEIVKRRSKVYIKEIKKKKELLGYAMELFELLDKEYEKLYGTVPLSKEQMQSYIDQYFGFITPDHVPLVFNEKDEMVAFGITMPSLSKALQKADGKLFPFGFYHLLMAMRNNDRVDAYLIAVKSEYQGQGVSAIILDHLIKVFNRLGYKYAESNPELETNLDVQGQWRFFEHRQHKRRRVFIKEI